LASLIEGGIEFDTVVSGGAPVNSGHRFDIYENQQAARDSLFTDPNAEVLEVAVLFDQSVSGLTVGSEVRLQGIRIGQVSELSAIVVGDDDNASVRLQALLAIEPTRLGMTPGASSEEALDLLSDLVTRGLRARMVTGNILAGTLVVELVTLEDALPAIVALTSGEYPVIPTTASKISDVAETAEGVLARINALPVEELMEGAIDLMDSFERLANDESTRATPEALVSLVDEARALVGSEALQAVPDELRDVIASLDALISQANDVGLISNIDVAVQTATRVADNIEIATRNLPQISDDIAQLTARANSLEFEALIASATEILAAVDAFIGNEDTLALPASLNGALDEMRDFLAEVNGGDAMENLNSVLATANQAALAVEEAVSTLPALAERANRLVLQTETVIESYSERSRFGAETLQTLRDIQSAADAVTTLSRTIQRNPNSLLTGR
jgi:paraquat-inducible protein B